MLRLGAGTRRLAATSSSTGPQQQNTDDHNSPVDNASSQNTFKYIKMPKTHLISDNEKDAA